MKSRSSSLLGLLASVVVVSWLAITGVVVVDATTLTYQLQASEKACFYVWVDQPGKRVAFYFAVQSGGNFDVDYSVTDPVGKVLLSGEKERQGDFVYTVQTVGEHKHCIFNTMSTYTAKLVDIELTAQDDKFSVSAKLPQAKSIADEHLSPLEESLYKISADLSQIARNQKYFRTRENRNFATVQSTESRIFWFSLFENTLIVGMSALQVFIVRTFFSSTTKARI